jgi:hypothetical protein
MKMTSVLLTLGLFLASASAFAAKGEGKIGPAGCGLGNMLMGTDSQIFAATTNGTGMQTFGITTGTSNCGAGGFSSQMDIFVESNKVALSNDAARGQGETIAALSSMLGCQDSAAVGSTLKANYGEIFEANKNNSHAISTAIQTKLQTAHTCARNS